MESSNQAAIDVENPRIPLAASMEMEFDTLTRLSSECCIYRVPERLRRVREKVYTPQVVSIGPLHHGKDGLKAMEEHKMRFLWDYIQRTNVRLEDYINIVKDNEPKLRSCYAETIGFSSDEFVRIILVDSAFIIEVFLRAYIEEFREEKNDRIFHKPRMVEYIWTDLLLLENQLPFFILEELFYPNKIEFPPEYVEEFSFIKLSYEFFRIWNLYSKEAGENLKKMNSTTIQHFVDFLRNMFLPESPRERERCESLSLPSITELYQAGIKFKVSSSKILTDIQFENGTLEIPKSIITAATEMIMRNLIAFEQCHYEEKYLNDYVMTMNFLVNTPKDVELLVKNGIVETLWDNIKTSTLLQNLGDGVTVTFDSFFFANIFKNLNAYCNVSWHKWKANLKQNYFNTPWAIVSVIAAVVVIVLTVVQAVCSIISVI